MDGWVKRIHACSMSFSIVSPITPFSLYSFSTHTHFPKNT